MQKGYGVGVAARILPSGMPGCLVQLLSTAVPWDVLGSCHGHTLPDKLDAHLSRVWYKVFSLLGVRRNITLLWRTLPERFQGLGMPNFIVVAFASKVFFLQCHWGFSGATADSLHWNYEAFIMEVGLYGNVFS